MKIEFEISIVKLSFFVSYYGHQNCLDKRLPRFHQDLLSIIPINRESKSKRRMLHPKCFPCQIFLF